MKPSAILSVSNKTGIIELAKALVNEFGYQIISSGGTAKCLADANIPVIKVSDFTSFPEILGGRVKTLNPRVHGGILADRSNPDHMVDIKANNIDLIDLVVVNLYPFKEVTSNSNCSFKEGIENIDIGGPTMIRAAAKNNKFVSILTNPNQYEFYLQLRRNQKETFETRLELAIKAFEHTADYDSAITRWMATQNNSQESTWNKSLTLIQNLRYGENPHQEANWYGLNDYGWATSNQISGKELSTNNLLDLDAALLTLLEFEDKEYKDENDLCFSAVIVKHNNPCGVAQGNSSKEAFERALDCDKISAFGGIVALNNKVDKETAYSLKENFLECIVAPGFEKEALEILREKKNLRLLQINFENFLKNKNENIKSILGGIIVQDLDYKFSSRKTWEVVTEEKPDENTINDLWFAWKVAKHVKSNSIVLANQLKTIGIGAGQMNRVGAAKIALESNNSIPSGTVLASDGFFPFKDTIEMAYKYGVKSIIQPGGSLRDKESIDFCNEFKISMVITGQRHFLH
tara:strand:+ start:2460 stop:4016 length:1557 start_codon:yes stop_codon:yes gene_type:complete